MGGSYDHPHHSPDDARPGPGRRARGERLCRCDRRRGVDRHSPDTERRHHDHSRRRDRLGRYPAARDPSGQRRGGRGRQLQPAPSGLQERQVPEEAARRARRCLQCGCDLEPGARPELRGPQPPRPATRQRGEPVLARAARPGALRRQRVHRRVDEQRPPCLEHCWRTRADRGPGPQHVLRLPRRDQPHDRCSRAERHRPGVPLRPGEPALHRRDHHARCGCERRLQRQEHDRPRREQLRRPHGRVDDLPRARAERRHGRHAGPRVHARRHGARPVLPGLPAHRRRRERRLRDDERVRPLRAVVQRRADLRVLEDAAGGASGLDRRHARGEPERRRVAGVHGVARHLAGRSVLERAQRHRVLPQHRSPATARRPATRRAPPAGSASGR